jgi:integrase
MGKPSVVYQVTQTLNSIFVPGASRHELKARGLAGERITCIDTMKHYVKECCRFTKWCKANYGVRDIGRITPAMAGRYVDGLYDRECAGGYIGKVKAAIRKFDVAMRFEGLRPRDAEPLLQAGGGWHSDRRPERAYTPYQADCIIDNMRDHARDKQAADVAQLQRVAGLRISEAAMIRGQDIDPQTCTIYAVKGTKGGRPRTVSVDPKHRPFLEKLTARAEQNSDGFVFQGRGKRGKSLGKRVAGAVRHACQRLDIPHYSTHGFRRTWAQERHNKLQEQGLDDRDARQAVSTEMGHRRIDVTYSYIPR